MSLVYTISDNLEVEGNPSSIDMGSNSHIVGVSLPNVTTNSYTMTMPENVGPSSGIMSTDGLSQLSFISMFVRKGDISSDFISSGVNFTSTSTVPVVLPFIVLSLQPGTYFITFIGTCNIINSRLEFGIYNNGILEPFTFRVLEVLLSSSNDLYNITTSGIVTLTNPVDVDVRVNVGSGGTFSVFERELLAIKLI